MGDHPRPGGGRRRPLRRVRGRGRLHGPGGTTIRLTFDQLADEVADRHPGHRGQRDRAGRPGGHLGPQLRRVGGRRPGRRRGRGLAGAAQHPVQGGRGRLHPACSRGPGCSSPSRGSSAPTTPAARRGGGRPGTRCPSSSGWWCCGPATAAVAPPTAKGDQVVEWEVFLQEGGACSADVAAGRTASITSGDLSDLVFTSGTTGQPQGGDDHPRPDAAHLRHLVRGGRAAPGGPLPHRQPLLPHLRVQGRDPGLPDDRGHHGPRAGLRRRTLVMQRVDDERITVLPGPPTIFQSILDHPDRKRIRPLLAPPGGHRRRRGPGRAGAAPVVRPRHRDGAHRLRADRGHRDGDHVPAGRLGRGDLGDVGTGHPRRGGPDRRRRRGRGARRARPARSWSGATT